MRSLNRWLCLVLSISVVFVLLTNSCGPKAAPAPPPATPAPTSTPTATPKPSAPPTTVAPAPPRKVYEWKLATYYKEGDIRLPQIQRWVEAVGRASGGAISIKIYPAETLVKSADYPAALSKGVVELATPINASNFAGIIPVAAYFTLFPPSDLRKYLMDAELLRIVNKETAAKMNSYYISLMPTGGQEWFMNVPFTSPEQMKGKLIRSVGGIFDDFITVWGGKPVLLPSAEVYTAGQRGVIDGCTLGTESYQARKIYEIFPYELQAKIWESTTVTHAINLDVWKSLTGDLQKVLTDTTRGMLMQFLDEVTAADALFLEKLRKDGLVKMHEISPELRNEWVRRALPAYEPQFKAAGPVGEEMLQYLKKTYWR